MQARSIGLVDFVFPDSGPILDDHIRAHVSVLLKDGVPRKGSWKRNVDLSPSALALVRAKELAEMSKEFWSPRAIRYHSRRSGFVRKKKPIRTPLRLALHRRIIAQPDEEETSEFDDIETYKLRAESELVAKLRDFSQIATSVDDNSLVRPSLPQSHDLAQLNDSTASGTLFPCHYESFGQLPVPSTLPESLKRA